MGTERTKLRPGIKGTEYPTTPLLLEKKSIKKHNVLIGEDPMQVRFAEQFLSDFFHTKVSCQFLDVVHDDHVLGQEESKLYRVDRTSHIELSPSVKTRVGIWSLDLIEKGGAGANAIVREACRLMGINRPERQIIDHITSEITKNLYDIKVAIWDAAWILTGPTPEKKMWPRPWDNYLTWLPHGEDPGYRLNTLYWELVEYVFAAENDENGFRKTGRTFRPREFKKLTETILPKDKVFTSITVLSAWKEHKTDPYVCALKLTKIWEH